MLPFFFSEIAYDTHVRGAETLALHQLQHTDLAVVTGIAKPKPFMDFLKGENLKFDEKHYPDHHHFTEKEVAALDQLPTILTTEKDYMRLKTRLIRTKLYYLPIRFSFLACAEKFDRLILNFISNYS